MKKLIVITLALILLPLLATAQKGEKTSIETFFKTYSERDGFSSVEVTEDMFKMFDEMEDADNELIDFFKKLKYVRFMEYQPTWTSSVGVTSKAAGSNYYVDGKAVNTTGIASGTAKEKSVSWTSSNEATASTASNVASKVRNRSQSSSTLYNCAIEEIDLKNYTQLMKSNQDGEKLIFLKRQWTSKPVDQEFVLINGNTLIHIRGDLNIKHLYELEEIIEAVGEILPN